MTHALFYSSGLDKNMSCYKNEAEAFANEIIFIHSLNAEELSSLNQRSFSSDSVSAVLVLLRDISNSYGRDINNKALNYVQNQTFYHNQCAGR